MCWKCGIWWLEHVGALRFSLWIWCQGHQGGSLHTCVDRVSRSSSWTAKWRDLKERMSRQDQQDQLEVHTPWILLTLKSCVPQCWDMLRWRWDTGSLNFGMYNPHDGRVQMNSTLSAVVSVGGLWRDHPALHGPWRSYGWHHTWGGLG